MTDVTIGDLVVGTAQPLTIIAGPCALESLDLAQHTAGTVKEACAAAGAQFIFKASYDKANRTSLSGGRGMGIDAGLKTLQAVRDGVGVPVLPDDTVDSLAARVCEAECEAYPEAIGIWRASHAGD